MKRTTIWLGALLAGQLALAVGLALSGPSDDASAAQAPLAEFKPEAVDRIVLRAGGQGAEKKAGEAGETIELAKGAKGWILPALGDFPADDDKVSGLLKTLSALKRGWPVAQTSDAVERFKVADDAFERRIELKAGDDTVATLYFGAAPGYRKIHARSADESEVYDVSFAIYDAPAQVKGWISHDALDLAKDQAARVQVGGVALLSGDKGFALDGLGETETTDPDAATKLVTAALRPAYDVVDAPGDGVALDKPDLEVRVATKAGETITRRYKADPDAKDGYVFTSSDDPKHRFHVAKARIKPLLETDRAKLVQKAKEPEAKDDGHSG